ncbi:MAG TPA: ATP-binding cassette domain-containing protein [Gaiellaceae bacterium]|nr:ATP-binding cassette domain-containing protein [Gaiellaceae bacterium]
MPAVATEPVTPATDVVPALRLRGVGRRFGGLEAVQDIDLEVPPGERRAILGPNGAGKTTLFNVIAGDLPATSGTVELFGRDITLLPARRRAGLGLARTYQQSRLLRGLSVEDNVYLSIVGVEGGHHRPVLLPRDNEIRRRAREAAGRVGLARKVAEPVSSLSHGEHRQVALAMALAVHPKVLMLDEPASGLSRGERQVLSELLLALDPSITLLVIEHDMDVALRVADEVTVLDHGRALVQGTTAEIRVNEQVRALYLGADAEEGQS